MTYYIGGLLGFGSPDVVLVPFLFLAVYLTIDVYYRRVLGQSDGFPFLAFLFAIPSFFLTLFARWRRAAPSPAVDPSAPSPVQLDDSSERPKFKRAR